MLYERLNRALEEKRVRREGTGRRTDPYRCRLPNEDDKYLDRGKLPPLRNMDFPPPPAPRQKSPPS
ncbi:MAG TPA: hypothetical protein VH120_07935 [Gemmataceae bacterium]|nr:hypothetical protein [Gemmataceae bacterium]